MSKIQPCRTELFEEYLEPQEDSLETLAELIIEEDIQPEDRNILGNESRNKIRETVRDWAESLDREGLDRLTEHRRDRGIFASSITQKMQAHDEEKPIEAYTYGAVDRIFFYPNAGIEESIEAGFAYVDALFEKDKVEDKYRDEEGVLDTEKMTEADDWDEEAIEIDYGQMKADFTLSDLGEWSEVYRAFKREADQMVKPFFQEETYFDGEKVAEFTALLETYFWRQHKVSNNPISDDPPEGYTNQLMRAIQVKFTAATEETDLMNDIHYGAYLYHMAVENHDTRNWKRCVENMAQYYDTMHRPVGRASLRITEDHYESVEDLIENENGLTFS
jgi:hypothetical protein